MTTVTTTSKMTCRLIESALFRRYNVSIACDAVTQLKNRKMMSP